MMMSMYSAVSGLKSQQTKLNVIGNNIANINTVGYKSQKVGFSDLLSQNISGASGASGTMGGKNAKQIGLGSQVSSIEMVMNPGSSQYTGSDTDVAIGGEGFFIVQGNTEGMRYYTRAGNFGVDESGNLVVNGMKVCGYDPAPPSNITPLNIFNSPGTKDGAKYTLQKTATKTASLMGNFDNSKTTAASQTEVATTLTVYDSLGNTHETVLTFKNQAPPNSLKWDVTATTKDGTVAIDPTPFTVEFNGTGTMTSATSLDLKFTAFGTGADDSTVKVDLTGLFGGASASGTSNVKVSDIDGYDTGMLQDFSIGTDGTITGSYSNGLKKSLGQLAMMTFSNPSGLEKIGDNLYDRTMNSGEPTPGTPGSGQAAKLTTGALEMSNVDLANEFSEMMITQRAYQANSKIITTSDTLMETLINMSR